MSTSIKLDIHLASGTCGHRVIRKGKRPAHAKPVRLPRVTRLMALSIKYEHMIRHGLVRNHDELADLAGVDRSQVSRIVRLRLLSPEIQEWLLNLPETEPGGDPIDFADLRKTAAIPSWEEQRKRLCKQVPDFFPTTRAECTDNHSNAFSGEHRSQPEDAS
ncbi:hypothetical protein P4E94_18640 [Pontiellaceae bacterium B12219]|nr:hypothetical protein [Pontiellaceae bacterium B12219]